MFPSTRRCRRPAPRTVLITGAASGIGAALAHWYSSPAVELFLLDRAPLEPAALPSSGIVRTAIADVGDPRALGVAIAALADRRGFDRVIHCAGVLPPVQPLPEVDPQDMARTASVNLVGSFHLAQAALPHLHPGSHLVLMGSLGGLVAGHRYFAYSASKFGVVGLAEALRMELARDGIRTQVVCPGEVLTPLVSAEAAVADPGQRALKRLSGRPITAQRAAGLIGRGIESRRFYVVPTFQAKALWWTTRLAPTSLRHSVADQVIRTAEQRSREAIVPPEPNHLTALQ